MLFVGVVLASFEIFELDPMFSSVEKNGCCDRTRGYTCKIVISIDDLDIKTRRY